MTEPVHRTFLAAFGSDVDPPCTHGQWTTRHAQVFARTTGLRGNTQNRPPREFWSGRPHVCSETWFDDHAAEKATAESDYDLTDVAGDVARFVHRDQALAVRPQHGRERSADPHPPPTRTRPLAGERRGLDRTLGLGRDRHGQASAATCSVGRHAGGFGTTISCRRPMQRFPSRRCPFSLGPAVRLRPSLVPALHTAGFDRTRART